MQIHSSCSKLLLKEIHWRNFSVSHGQIEQFYQSQWQSRKNSLTFLIYRWLWALFFIGVLTLCLILQFSDGKVFIFLTNWGIILCTATQVIAAVLVTKWYFNIGNINENVHDHNYTHTPAMVKVYWVLHSVSLLLALVITTVYWAFLHGKMNKPVRHPTLSFITHCLNSVFMLIDFILIGFPFRLLHVVYAMLLPIFYCLFTVVYYFCGGTDDNGNRFVYPILNWKNPGRGLITFAGVFVLYLIYGITLFCLHKLKQWIHRTIAIIWKPQLDGLI